MPSWQSPLRSSKSPVLVPSFAYALTPILIGSPVAKTTSDVYPVGTITVSLRFSATALNPKRAVAAGAEVVVVESSSLHPAINVPKRWLRSVLPPFSLRRGDSCAPLVRFQNFRCSKCCTHHVRRLTLFFSLTESLWC